MPSLQTRWLQRVVKTHRFCCNDAHKTGRVDAHLMGCVFPYKNLVVGVPEANAPIAGGADADVTLPCMLTERKA